MTAPLLRYPALAWDRELDAIEREFDDSPDAETPEPAAQRRIEPRWHAWLAVLIWPIAALCAVGLMVGVVG